MKNIPHIRFGRNSHQHGINETKPIHDFLNKLHEVIKQVRTVNTHELLKMLILKYLSNFSITYITWKSAYLSESKVTRNENGSYWLGNK